MTPRICKILSLFFIFSHIICDFTDITDDVILYLEKLSEWGIIYFPQISDNSMLHTFRCVNPYDLTIVKSIDELISEPSTFYTFAKGCNTSMSTFNENFSKNNLVVYYINSNGEQVPVSEVVNTDQPKYFVTVNPNLYHENKICADAIDTAIQCPVISFSITNDYLLEFDVSLLRPIFQLRGETKDLDEILVVDLETSLYNYNFFFYEFGYKNINRNFKDECLSGQKNCRLGCGNTDHHDDRFNVCKDSTGNGCDYLDFSIEGVDPNRKFKYKKPEAVEDVEFDIRMMCSFKNSLVFNAGRVELYKNNGEKISNPTDYSACTDFCYVLPTNARQSDEKNICKGLNRQAARCAEVIVDCNDKDNCMVKTEPYSSKYISVPDMFFAEYISSQ